MLSFQDGTAPPRAASSFTATVSRCVDLPEPWRRTRVAPGPHAPTRWPRSTSPAPTPSAPAGARKAADAVAERLRAEYGVRSQWKGDTLHVTGRGIGGRLDAGPGTVRVTAKLSLLARAFAGPLRREIERELDRVAPLS